jgi:hypothetical protein
VVRLVGRRRPRLDAVLRQDARQRHQIVCWILRWQEPWLVFGDRLGRAPERRVYRQLDRQPRRKLRRVRYGSELCENNA